jgi:hypothetical protein
VFVGRQGPDHGEVSASSTNECCSKCAADATCQGFSYSEKGCWLKSNANASTFKPDSEHTSGVIVKRDGCSATLSSSSSLSSSVAAGTNANAATHDDPPSFIPQWHSVAVQLSLHVGGQQPPRGGQATAPSNILSASVEITGESRPLDDCPALSAEYPNIVPPPL